jgi:enediyne biosynthesis protein E4
VTTPLWRAAAAAIALAAAQTATRPADAPAWFVNAAASAGVAFRHTNGASPDRHLHEIMSGGGLFLDYDNDGWLDIFLVDGGSLTDSAVAAGARHRLFRNRGNGTFEDATARSGISHRSYGMGACAADYDNDGFTDLYVTAVGVNALYRNAAGKSFVDVTKAAGVGSSSFAASCAFGDLDRDGDVDLVVVNYVDARLDNNVFCGDASKKLRVYCHPLNFKPLTSVLYRNDGNGTFTDVSRESGIGAAPGNGLGIVMADYDDDGLLDVFVANDTTPNFLFHNQGKGRFAEVALRAGVAVATDGRRRAGMGTDFGDVDGDGDLDLFVTNHELETHTLYRNLGKGLFSEATAESGLATPTLPFVGFGTVLADHDNDGDLDVAIVNGHVVNMPELVRPGAKEAQRKLLFVNDARGRMREVGRQAGPGFADERIGRTLAAGDIDNDGDLDLLVTNNGAEAELLRNELGPGPNALMVKLVGVASNRSAVGARLRVTAAGKTYLREVKAGSSYLGQNDLRQHVGLAQAMAAERVEIRWPSGAAESLIGVSGGQVVTVTEGRGITARLPFVRR